MSKQRGYGHEKSHGRAPWLLCLILLYLQCSESAGMNRQGFAPGDVLVFGLGNWATALLRMNWRATIQTPALRSSAARLAGTLGNSPTSTAHSRTLVSAPSSISPLAPTRP